MLSSLKSRCYEIIKEVKTASAYELLDTDYTHFDQPLFCDYQKKLVLDSSPVLVLEKGRQIGYSWVMSFKAVIKAASNEKDTVYMSYNRESAKDFMRDVQRWCRIFNLAYSMYENECIDDRAINIFECNFLNLRKIIAVSGDCTNLRGKPGADVIIDEAAYNQNSISDVIAASMATLIHGGSVTIGGTHAGVDSDFNQLIDKIKAGDYPYTLMKVTFKQAVSQGLYKRICARKKEVWEQEKENIWISEIYNMYGLRASEELDAEPTDYSQSGKIFKTFEYIDLQPLNPWEYVDFRYHDLAASKDPDDLNASACYSASVKVRYVYATQKIIVVDWQAEKLSPLEGDAMIEQLALQDGSKSVQIIEEEPGSTGLKYVAIMQERLIRQGVFQVFGYKPMMQKVKRAIPVANGVISGEVLIDQNLNNREEFIKYLQKFSSKPTPLVTDLTDCLSGAYDYIKNEYNFLMG
jgi:phage terminase large subunit-like protein